MNLRLFKLLYQNWFYGKNPTAPFKHIVQIGDPILRQKAEPVDPTLIKNDFMKKLLNRLNYLMKCTGAAGLSAPQLGVSLRVFAVQCPEKKKFWKPELYEKCGMEPLPYQVWINPEIKILDYNQILNEERCESMRGFSAEILRYPKLILTGLDEDGKPKSLEAKKWIARTIQHEMDHLDGKFFTDIMVPKSLTCCNWNAINFHQGRIYMTYMPKR